MNTTVKNNQFAENVKYYREYIEKEGKIPSQRTKINGLAIGEWVSNQRTQYSKGKLSPERIAHLESLPLWSWNRSLDEQWKKGNANIQIVGRIARHQNKTDQSQPGETGEASFKP